MGLCWCWSSLSPPPCDLKRKIKTNASSSINRKPVKETIDHSLVYDRPSETDNWIVLANALNVSDLLLKASFVSIEREELCTIRRLRFSSADDRFNNKRSFLFFSSDRNSKKNLNKDGGVSSLI